ncbi:MULTISPECIES: FG-GAP-like repeat-containing protein [unclassified Streptomyces]|uniref:FG-GAP-like repeat-containing protein n=1 Tax=unclassified Streptomyces TaxID=2593676 RepID=UPI0038177634
MRISIPRRLAAAATTLGLASFGLLGAGAAPAQAAATDCPAGYFCAWKTDNATGTMYKTNTSAAKLGAWDNAFRSVVNRTNRAVCLYDDPDYGLDGMVGVVESSPSGSEWGGPGSTTVSSVKLVTTERECVMEPYPDWYAATSPKASGFGDLNNDRKADVLARDKAGRLWFLPGDGSGQLVGTGGWNAFNTLTRHGDLSGDGKEDVIAREAATGKLWLYPGTGKGTLGARTLIGTGGWNGMSQFLAFGDMNGDTRLDVIAVEKSTGKLWLYPGTTAGTLGPRALMGTGGWNGMNSLVGAGDMNGDTRADLIAREPSTGKLWLYPGKAGGGFGNRLSLGTGWNAMGSLLTVGDYNGDGHNDLVAVTNSSYNHDGLRGVGILVLYGGTGKGTLNTGSPESDGWWDLNGTF